MPSCKVSVLVPVYKTRPDYLRAAIGSVLAQTFRDFELLLLDDCPEDDREAVVREFDDARIVYRKNARNLGISETRNRLIEMARSEYLAVFDHDDICRPERLAKEVAYLDAHPECGVVGGWIKPSNGVPTRFPEDDHAIRVAMMEGISVWHPAALIRASLLRGHALRYEAEYSPAEDYMLWMRLLPHTQFHNLQEVVLEYRLHGYNTSLVQRENLVANDMRCKAWASVNLPELWAEAGLRRRQVVQVRILGVPVLKKLISRREETWLLFGKLPVVSVRRRLSI